MIDISKLYYIVGRLILEEIIDFRGILILDVQTGIRTDQSDQIQKLKIKFFNSGSGSDGKKRIQIHNPGINSVSSYEMKTQLLFSLSNNIIVTIYDIYIYIIYIYTYIIYIYYIKPIYIYIYSSIVYLLINNFFECFITFTLFKFTNHFSNHKSTF